MSLPVLPVSSDEVISALQRSGFTLTERTKAGMVLTLGVRDVVVPVGWVGDDALRGLLRAAGVSYSDFLHLLETVDVRPPPPASCTRLPTGTKPRARAIRRGA